MSNRKSKTETPSLREASNRIKYKNSISKIIKYKDGYNKLINIIQNHLNKSDENINNVDIKINNINKEINDIDKEINRKTRSIKKTSSKQVLDPFSTPSKNKIKYSLLYENLSKKKKLRNSLKQKLFITLRERDSFEEHKKTLKKILEQFIKTRNKIQTRFKVYKNLIIKKYSLNPNETKFLKSEVNAMNREFRKDKNGVGKLDKWKNISIITEKENNR